MESKQKYIKTEEKIKVLKEIINDVFFSDIDSENRKRINVDARKVFTKLMREMGFSYEKIGELLGKDHATTMHYHREIEALLRYNPTIYKKYIICRKTFNMMFKDQLLDSNQDIYENAINMSERLEKYAQDRKSIAEEFYGYLSQYKRKYREMPSLDYCRDVLLPLF